MLVGEADGECEGLGDGTDDGQNVGALLGRIVGKCDGMDVGAVLGRVYPTEMIGLPPIVFNSPALNLPTNVAATETPSTPG
jgi:hypothetical protein